MFPVHAPPQLGSLIVHNATTTRSRLILTAREHYERELKQQAFLMLGSLEAFGNPVGLLRGMGQVGAGLSRAGLN